MNFIINSFISSKVGLNHRSITSVTTQVYLFVQTDDSDKVVRRLERELQSNEYGHGVRYPN